jgi:hypothetical protein
MMATARRATIILRNGRGTFVCDEAEIIGREVRLVGRLRNRTLAGDFYGETVERTFRLAEVRRIAWHRDRGGQR